jgi:hypothetical protein
MRVDYPLVAHKTATRMNAIHTGAPRASPRGGRRPREVGGGRRRGEDGRHGVQHGAALARGVTAGDPDQEHAHPGRGDGHSRSPNTYATHFDLDHPF